MVPSRKLSIHDTHEESGVPVSERDDTRTTSHGDQPILSPKQCAKCSWWPRASRAHLPAIQCRGPAKEDGVQELHSCQWSCGGSGGIKPKQFWTIFSILHDLPNGYTWYHVLPLSHLSESACNVTLRYVMHPNIIYVLCLKLGYYST